MDMAVKTMKGAARGAGRRRGGSFPAAGIMGERRAPLSPLPSWLLGSPPPWRWDPWGRQKRGFWRLPFMGGGVPHELGFLPLYSFSDFCHPI
jgi:hypothetical protein